MVKIGAHLSVSGGISRAAQKAVDKNLDCLQIFSGSPRTWQAPAVGTKEAESFRAIIKKGRLRPVFIHAKYLVNPASDSRQTTKKSISSLMADLKIAGRIKAAGVIFHPKLKNFRPLVKNIRFVLKQIPPEVELILENSAQMGLADLGKLAKTLDCRRLKICLDTAHLFQSGINLNAPEGRQKLFAVLEKQIGPRKLAAVHLNNSKTKPGSKHDVHADLSAGLIKPAAFFVLANHPATKNKPFILETPSLKKKDWGPTQKNIDFFKKAAGRRLQKRFFARPTLKVAKELLGKYLVVDRDGCFQVGRITETEAYIGQKDRASHASRGKTKRTAPMFGPAARLYIYLVYGMHHCLNVVTEKEGFPAAVLIRALEPVFGVKGEVDGPGKLCRRLGLTQSDNGRDIAQSGEIYIKDAGRKPEKIIALPRVGVDYAGRWAKKKWRFRIAGSW